MSQTIRKSFLSISLFFAMGLSATACGPEEGFDNGEQSGSTAVVEQAAVSYQNYRSGVTDFWGRDFCLKVAGGVVSDGTPARIYECNQSGRAQLWYYDPGTYELKSALDPNYCLDVWGAVVANGTTVQIYTCNGTLAQKWTRINNEFHTQLNENYCLHVAGGEAANGTAVTISTCTGKPAQKWFVL